MPFTSGTFANIAGASSAAAGQIVQSAVWNAIHVDYSTAFTQLMQQLLSTVSNRNICWMNGGFEIWQRGAGGAADISLAQNTTAYTADRWYLTTGANQASTVSQQVGLTSASNFSAKVQRTAAQTGTTAMIFGYPLDTDELIRMRGSKVTISFLVQAGATFSPASGTLTATLFVGTGAVAKRGGGFSSETTVLAIATNLTAGGAAVSVSGTSSAVVPATAAQGEIQFTWTPVGTAGATDNFTVDDLQIECNLTSTTWTPMDFDRLDFNTMLNGCKIYYQKTMGYSAAPTAGAGVNGSIVVNSQAIATIGFWWMFPEQFRVSAPSVSISKLHVVTATGSNWYNFITSATVSASIRADISGGTKGIFITGVTGSADVPYSIHLVADAGI